MLHLLSTRMLKVHRELGPGLLESTYQLCLAHELRGRGIKARREVVLPVKYAGLEIEAGYRIDLFVAECIIVAEQIGASITSSSWGAIVDESEAVRMPARLPRQLETCRLSKTASSEW